MAEMVTCECGASCTFEEATFGCDCTLCPECAESMKEEFEPTGPYLCCPGPGSIPECPNGNPGPPEPWEGECVPRECCEVVCDPEEQCWQCK